MPTGLILLVVIDTRSLWQRALLGYINHGSELDDDICLSQRLIFEHWCWSRTAYPPYLLFSYCMRYTTYLINRDRILFPAFS